MTDSPGRGRWHEVPEGEQGVTEGDGEGEDAGLVLRLFEILTITECIIFVKTICWNC